ncbi:hypothetical protein ACFL1A_02755 [Patescibacteria group bacterium]
MANLTETAYYTRRAINWSILAVLLYIILRLFWGVLVFIWFLLFPLQPPPPNHAFGVLPAIKFPSTATPSAEYKFKLETIEGSVPKASNSAVVFFLPKQAPNLLALTKTQEFAKKLVLNPKPIQESKNQYRFDDEHEFLRTLHYDIVTSNFNLNYIYKYDTGLFSENEFPTQDKAKSESINMLDNYDLYKDDIENGIINISYLKLVGDELVETNSVEQANAIRVDFKRDSIINIPIYTPNPDRGPIYFIYSGSKNVKKRLLEFNYTYWPIDLNTTATYKLKTSQQAWQELQSGLGYIAKYPSQGTQITVREVFIGYYDSFKPQTYLQPIFVFEGDDGFVAYVPAVDSEWVEK